MFEHVKGATPDLAKENLEKLKTLFPSVVTEGPDGININVEALKQEFSATPIEGNVEHYEFTWPGKRAAKAEAYRPTTKTLRPSRAESVGKDGTPGGFDSENLYIEGDNLEVLKLLRMNYTGAVKMIYIDPPYNTGKDFVYRDSFSLTEKEIKNKAGSINEDGAIYEKNDSAEARYHTNWCNMMLPRLKLAKDLLREDGVIFISIDDNEVTNLRRLCDEVFGGSNFVAQFAWAAGRKNDSKHVSISHEYIAAYFKDAQYIADNKIIWRERKQGLDNIYAAYDSLRKQYGADNAAVEKGLKDWFSALPDGHPAKDHAHYNKVDDNGIFFASDISWPGGGGPKYEVLHPVTQKPVTVPSRGWITNVDTMKQWIDEGRVYFGDDENAVPTLKSYLKEHETGVPYSVFYKDGRAASKRLKTLLGDKVFENPKDEDVLRRLIEFSGTGERDIVVDFFSGSGSTAHALLLAEAAKPIGRKFILVQLEEVIDPDKCATEKSKKIAKSAVAFLDSIHAKHTICEIGKERIRRAGKKILDELKAKEEKAQGELSLGDGGEAVVTKPDVGFRVLKLAEGSYLETSKKVGEITQESLVNFSKIKDDRSGEDLLFQMLLETDIKLSESIDDEIIEGNKVYFVGGTAIAAALEKDMKMTEEFVKALAARKPGTVFFRDDSFGGRDDLKISVEQIFKQMTGDLTKVKVI